VKAEEAKQGVFQALSETFIIVLTHLDHKGQE
jgi:hypothetical protein